MSSVTFTSLIRLTHGILRAVAAQIARLIFLRQLRWSTDITYDAVAYSIATQCQMTLAVVTASIPALKPFMDRATSGLIAVSLGQRGGTYGISDTYALQTFSNSHVADSGANKKIRVSTSGLSEGAISPGDAKVPLRPERAGHHAVSTLKLNSPNEEVQLSEDLKDEGGSNKVMIHNNTVSDMQCNNKSHLGHRNRQPVEEHNGNSSPKIMHAHTVF